jgi:putative membrane protein
MTPERIKVRRVRTEGAEPPSEEGGPPRPPGEPGCGWLLLKWVLYGLSIYLTAWLLEPNVHVRGFVWALVVAVVVGLMNVIVRPILVVLTLPVTVVTLGLFLIVINAVILALAGWLLAGFEIRHFGWALLAAALISGINVMLSAFLDGLVGRRSGS